MKFNLRTKAFIVFMIITVILIIPKLSILSQLPFSTSFSYYLTLIIYPICLFLFFYKKSWTKNVAWILAVTPSLVVLFNPLRAPTSPDLYIGSVPTLVVSLVYNDLTTGILQLMRSVAPLVILLNSVSNIIKYGNKKFDVYFSVIFILSLVIFELFPINTLVFGMALSYFEIIKIVIISLIYLVSTILWIKLDIKNIK